jgi:glycosyltransferase involved in cell wall biosynthesis
MSFVVSAQSARVFYHRMQIAIDAHHIGGRRTGTETYVQNLVKFLGALEPNGDTYAVYLNEHELQHGWKGSAVFEARHIRSRVAALRYGWFYPLESWRRRFDVFHAQSGLPPFLRCRTVLTVYDLAFERFPHFFRRRIWAQMKIMVRQSCHRADHIITISESSKRDLVEFYRVDPERITVTYPAAPENCRPMDAQKVWERLSATYGIDAPYVLYVGNLEPRKNLPRLLEAFAELKRKQAVPHKLVLVGQKAWLCESIFQGIGDHSLKGYVYFTGYVPSDDLPVFYSGASVMVYPSIFEGFGLPVVEAMACGAPVITSLGSSLEEIAKDAAVLVDPYSVSEIANAIERVANDTELQGRLGHLGLRRAAQFSYRRMAEETRSVYCRL